MNGQNMNNGHYEDGLYGSDSPIVIFFGQTKSGKSTALVRLIKYLYDTQYTSDICPTFHNYYYPKKVPNQITLQQVQTDFDNNLTCEINNVKSTAYRYLCNINPLGAGTAECRFLEAPGEDLFALQNAEKTNIYAQAGGNVQYAYLNDIINTTSYKKIWIFFMDPEFTNELQNSNAAYINAIQNIPIREEDNVIFVLNKEDLVKQDPIAAPILKKGYKVYINAKYGNILTKEPFTTETYKWWRFWSQHQKKEHFRVLPFCAYTDKTVRNLNEDEEISHPLSDPSYPQNLWDTIQAAINNEF